MNTIDQHVPGASHYDAEYLSHGRAFSIAAQLAAVSTTLSLMARGTPSATPLADPKLDRMSLRTTPSSVSTLTPFDPSPG